MHRYGPMRLRIPTRKQRIKKLFFKIKCLRNFTHPKTATKYKFNLPFWGEKIHLYFFSPRATAKPPLSKQFLDEAKPWR